MPPAQWPTKVEFNADLLEALANADWHGAAAHDEETLRLAREIVEAHSDKLATTEGRRAVQLEAVRQAAWRNFTALTQEPNWRMYSMLALTVSSVADDSRREQLFRKLCESDAFFSRNMADFYREMTKVLGLRAKPPFTDDDMYQVLAKVGGALVEGLALHHAVDPDLSTARYEGPGGEWSIPALGFLAIMDMVSEPIPEVEPTQP